MNYVESFYTSIVENYFKLKATKNETFYFIPNR